MTDNKEGSNVPELPGKPSVQSGGEEDALAEEPPEQAEETEAQKKKRQAEEQKQQLKQFGGPVSLWKLVSLATPFELAVLFFGTIATLAHGAAQPMTCLMFGELIDALAVPVNVTLNMTTAMVNNVNMTTAMTASGGGAMDAGDNQNFLDNIGQIALKFAIIGVVVTALGTIQGSVYGWFAEKQVRRMRPIYFDAALHRDVSWYDKHDGGSLASAMGEDMDNYAAGFGNKLGLSFMSIGAATVGFALGIYLEWKVGLLMLVAVPVMCLGDILLGQGVMELRNETQGAYIRAATIVNEVLFAMRTVVSFGGERKELQRFGVEVEAARKGGVYSRAKTGFGLGYTWIAYFSSMALAFWFGMTLIYDGEKLSVGNMLAAFFCVITAGFTIGQIRPGFTGIFKAQQSMARFFYMKDHEDEIQRRGQDDRKEVGPITSLQLNDVHFAYPARPTIRVLSGLCMDIQKGKKVAVVGESGSGKSTVMALLERFYDPQQGQVLVNGEDLKNFSVRSFRKQVGYVGQEPVLFATSVKANIKQGRADATDQEVAKVVKKAQLDFINKLPEKMDTFVGSGGSQFSGGQKQRIAIARALLKNPSVLFLDEATSALDSKSEREIQHTIDHIGSESGGMTMVTIAHRLSTVQNSDVIYVLQGGKVAEFGSHRMLTSKPDGLYRALAAAQDMAGDQDEDKDTKGSDGLQRRISLGSAGGSVDMTEAEKKTAAEAEEERNKVIEKTYKVPMRRLLSFCRPEWGYFVPGFLCALTSGACFPIIGCYVLVDAMVAYIQPDKEVMRKEVNMACIWFLVLGATKWMCTFGQDSCFGVIGEAMTKRCRMAMLTTMFRQEIGFHDNPEHTPGRLEKALQVYAYRVQVLCISLGEQADSLGAVVVGIVLAFIASWEMTLVMLVCIPIFVITQSIQIVVTMGAAQAENLKMRAAQQVIADAIMNVRTVQASGCERDLLELYQNMLKPPTLAQDIKSFGVGGFAFGIANGITFWVLSGGFWFMGFLIQEGRTDFEKGQAAFMGVLYAAMGGAMGGALSGDIGKAKVAAHDMFMLLDRKSAIDGLDPDGVVPKEGGKQIGRFEFKNVSFFYPFRPDVQVLNDLSFTIEAGQSVGVVGPSGSGKSTVMAMIQRFYDPQSGEVLIGQDKMALNQLDIRWWRKQVGYVGQEPILFNVSVLANVKYGLSEGEEVSQEHLEKCKRMANLNFLDSHKAQGWETQVGNKGCRLSGGQKQRVAICRALVRNPPVLLLDEATSALDTKSERLVQVALEAARQDRTSFAIAHRLSTIQDCDVILVVAEGRIVERGSHSELLALGGVYHKLQAQAGSAEAKTDNVFAL